MYTGLPAVGIRGLMVNIPGEQVFAGSACRKAMQSSFAFGIRLLEYDELLDDEGMPYLD
jgi:hypothetical protein